MDSAASTYYDALKVKLTIKGGQEINSILLDGVSRPLMILHALLAMALLGASTHQSILAIGFILKRYRKAGLEALYLKIMVTLYGATFALGSLIYPAYRVRIRRDVFDISAPWASHLFDIKENLAAIGLFALVAMVLIRPALKPSDQEAERPWILLYAALVLTLGVFNCAMVIMGLYVGAERGL